MALPTTYLTELDVANRALQHLGARYVTSLDTDVDTSKNAEEISRCYDKLRDAELRRNVWTFATRKTVLYPLSTSSRWILQIDDWDAASEYAPGSLVKYNSEIYFAKRGAGGSTGNPAGDTFNWGQYFGPLVVNPWVSSSANNSSNNGYWAGDLVYTPGNAGYAVYMSLASANTDDPTNIPAWSATTTYGFYDTVTYLSVTYQSLKTLNLNVIPTNDGINWQTVPVDQVTVLNGSKWLRLTGVFLEDLKYVYPIGAGPVEQTEYNNVYPLPNNFLREAPQDPKAGSVNYLGAPSNLSYNDWVYENGFLISGWAWPIIYRFVASVNDVSKMDAMFCEGLACRIAMETCEALTQSTAKVQAIGAFYKEFMGEARIVAGIEQGPTEPPLDDYLQCRY